MSRIPPLALAGVASVLTIVVLGGAFLATQQSGLGQSAWGSGIYPSDVSGDVLPDPSDCQPAQEPLAIASIYPGNAWVCSSAGETSDWESASKRAIDATCADLEFDPTLTWGLRSDDSASTVVWVDAGGGDGHYTQTLSFVLGGNANNGAVTLTRKVGDIGRTTYFFVVCENGVGTIQQNAGAYNRDGNPVSLD